MTEAEWLAYADPTPMLKLLRDKASNRKLRLFGCACCRVLWHLLIDDRSRNAVEFAERAADISLSNIEKQSVLEAACQASDDLEELCLPGLYSHEHEARWCAAQMADRLPLDHLWADISEIAFGASSAGNPPALLRDIFGNPFRPIALNPEWRTSTVIALAGQMYDSRDFAAMPILADALQDAGCEHEDILNHCRGDEPHVRGCWVVDLLLGKI